MTENEFTKYIVPFLVESTIDKTIVKVTNNKLEHFYEELHFSGTVVKGSINYPSEYYSESWRLSVFEKYIEFQDIMLKAIRRIDEKKRRKSTD